MMMMIVDDDCCGCMFVSGELVATWFFVSVKGEL
jgi:hypothetical protein